MAGKSPVVASAAQRRDLMALRHSRDRGEADRARALLLTLAGRTSPRIAEAFGVREDTVRLWRSAFMAGWGRRAAAIGGAGAGSGQGRARTRGGRGGSVGTGRGSPQLDLAAAGRRDREALRAISKHEKFEAGTNLAAWLMTILRNLFYSGRRRTQREVEDADGIHAATMISIPDQEDAIIVQDLHAALAKLPRGQRDAIMLVGAEGMAYEEAAAALGVNVGTLKSRVNRARNRLAELMGLIGEDGVGSSRSSSS